MTVLAANKISHNTENRPFQKKIQTGGGGGGGVRAWNFKGLGVLKKEDVEMGYSRKNPNRRRGLRVWNPQGHQRNSMWNFLGLIKNNQVEFPRVIKTK